MLIYVRQFFKIRVVFHTLYLWNEVGDPQYFCISDKSNLLSDCRKNFKKIYRLENLRANVLKWNSLQSVARDIVCVCMCKRKLFFLLLAAWPCVESARLPPMWPGFGSGPVPYVGWVCCWFSPCSEGVPPASPASSVFLPPQKPDISKSQFDQNRGPHENQLRLR